MRIFQHDGSGYAAHQTIETGENDVFDFFASKDLSKFLIGGTNGYVSSYEDGNGSYSLAETKFIGQPAWESLSDARE